MSDLVQLDTAIERRQILRGIAAAAVSGGLTQAQAQHVHQMASQAKAAAGSYAPKALKAHEFATVQRLAELIMPADDRGPSGKDAGTAEFIDLLSSQSNEMLAIYTGGILWLDSVMQDRTGKNFSEADETAQKALLDQIAYRRTMQEHPELAPGVRFFDWIRKMTVDVYFTSEAGTKDIGFSGNKGMAVFKVPAEAVQYAMRRMPA